MYIMKNIVYNFYTNVFINLKEANMKNLKKLITFLTLLVLSLSLISCNFSNITDLNKSEADKFDEFLNEEFENYVSSDYLTLHYSIKNPSSYNLENSEITLGSIDLDSFEDYDNEIDETYNKLTSFSYDQLTEEQKLTYDILGNHLITEKKSKGLYYYQSILHPTTGLQSNLPVTFAEYTFYDKDDAYDYIELLKDIENYFDDIIEFETEKSNQGLFMSTKTADAVINEINAFIANPDNNYLITSFNDKINELADLTTTEKDDLSYSNKDIVINSVLPSYKKLSKTLEELKSTSSNENGLCYFEDGSKYYEYLLANSTGSSKSVKEIEGILESRLNSKMKELQTLALAYPETVMSMYSDENFGSFSMTDPTEILNYLKEKISNTYPEGPSTNFTIKYVDKSLEESSSPAFYMIPPIDDYESNTIYINPTQVGNSNLFSTLAHEGYPGHLYQTTYFNNTNPHPIRKALSFDGYVEGFATYAEIDSYSLAGINSAAIVNLQQITSEINLALPTLLDIYINYDGYKREDVNKYLLDFGYDSSLTDYFFDTLVGNPTNYAKYYVGYLEFIQLQDKATTTLKGNFNIKDFNKVLLDVGPAPFAIVEKKVDEYILNN